VSESVDGALGGWEYKPGVVQARLARGDDGRQVVQMRVDCGLLQLEVEGRPDGSRPHGARTILDHLRRQARAADQDGESFVLGPEQCAEADREFMQYYHRRICWLALNRFDRALADADHTLALMDFVRDHSPGEDFTEAHEQYRGFVLFQRTQAAAARALEANEPESAIDEIRAGLGRLRAFFAERGAEEGLEEDAMVQHLRRIEGTLRKQHGIEATLREQLDLAVANEEYERAAELRDALRRRR
jgi:hypothetical protein